MEHRYVYLFHWKGGDPNGTVPKTGEPSSLSRFPMFDICEKHSDVWLLAFDNNRAHNTIL
jgi:hypothetical protein